MKVGYMSAPSTYGVFSVYRNLRAGLLPLGITVRWIGQGPSAVERFNDPLWAREREFGDVVAPESSDVDVMGKATVAHLVDQKYDAVFINPPQGRAQLNIVRYLPRSILRLMLVQMIGSGTYRVCAALRDHVHQTIGLAPRIEEDLVKDWRFEPARTTSGAGIDLTAYQDLPPRSPTLPGQPLRLLYFGRITEGQKGIFNLPKIMAGLAGEAVQLDVAGDGPDLAELKRRCEPFGDRVRFLGELHPSRIPDLLSQHDVFVFPTRYEGLPTVLLEAISAGCVPVCSNVRGVTDFVARDGISGLLFPVDDPVTAAGHIRRLCQDRALLHRLATQAMQDSRDRFSSSVIGKKYFALLSGLAASPPPIAEPLRLEDWNYPAAFNRGFRAYIPQRIKNLVRVWNAR